ncbi:MAG: hypothetical protein CMN76_16920 [Spirochaetaceae bacterium]|nr:hypothetical protein [Spirochaetaceae bacterium]
MSTDGQVSAEPWMTNTDVLAALAPPALRSIRASLPKNAAGDMDVERRRGGSRGAKMRFQAPTN